jgi:hypothetical protein
VSKAVVVNIVVCTATKVNIVVSKASVVNIDCPVQI